MRAQHCAAALALMLASGCSSYGQSAYADYFRVLHDTFSTLFVSSRVSFSQAAATPYPTIGYRIDGGAENMLVLATDTQGTLLWTSASHIVIQTRDGRINRTVGLPHDVAALNPAGGKPLPPPIAARNGTFTSQRIADFPDIGAYSVTISCVTSLEGRQVVKILERSIPTLRIVETCRAPSLDWHFRDIYWVDADSGMAWHSQQHIHPDAGVIETTIFRPPG